MFASQRRLDGGASDGGRSVVALSAGQQGPGGASPKDVRAMASVGQLCAEVEAAIFVPSVVYWVASVDNRGMRASSVWVFYGAEMATAGAVLIAVAAGRAGVDLAIGGVGGTVARVARLAQ